MSYGVSLRRGDGTLLTFDGHFNNFRVAEVIDHESQASSVENGGTPTASNFKTAPSISVPHTTEGPILVFRRFLGFRQSWYQPPSGSGYYRYFVNYRYLICGLSRTPSTGYGVVVRDALGNVAFNSADSYVEVYNTSVRARTGSFTAPAPPAGKYGYVLTDGVGQYNRVTIGEGPSGRVYVLYKQTVDVTSSRCVLSERGIRQLFSPSWGSKSPMLYNTKAEADAASPWSYNSALPVSFAAYYM